MDVILEGREVNDPMATKKPAAKKPAKKAAPKKKK